MGLYFFSYYKVKVPTLLTWRIRDNKNRVGLAFSSYLAFWFCDIFVTPKSSIFSYQQISISGVPLYRNKFAGVAVAKHFFFLRAFLREVFDLLSPLNGLVP